MAKLPRLDLPPLFDGGDANGAFGLA